MPIYDRGEPDEFETIDRRSDGVGWIAHPDEAGLRASHAVRGDDGVWLLDPIDAPGVDDLLAELGPVAGVAVLSDYHARDAAAFARRHDVPVHVPAWIDRGADRTDAPIERFEGDLGSSGFRAIEYDPFPGWTEAFLYRESDGTLYVPDSMAASVRPTVGDERIGLYLLVRLRPPGEELAGIDVERVLFGHGSGVFEGADAALADALAGARRRFPRALVAGGWSELKLAGAALR